MPGLRIPRFVFHGVAVLTVVSYDKAARELDASPRDRRARPLDDAGHDENSPLPAPLHDPNVAEDGDEDQPTVARFLTALRARGGGVTRRAGVFTQAMKRLEGRTAVVTGAAGGIGRAVAERLARAGCHLAL